MEKTQESLNASVNTLISGLEKFVSSKTVVCSPIHIDDTILIPLVAVSFGVGAGAMGEGEKGAGAMGGRVTPNSVIVIHNGITRLINISTHTGLDRILDMVPDFVDRFQTRKAEKAEVRTCEEARAAAGAEIRTMVEESAENHD